MVGKLYTIQIFINVTKTWYTMWKLLITVESSLTQSHPMYFFIIYKVTLNNELLTTLKQSGHSFVEAMSRVITMFGKRKHWLAFITAKISRQWLNMFENKLNVYGYEFLQWYSICSQMLKRVKCHGLWYLTNHSNHFHIGILHLIQWDMNCDLFHW